MTIAELLRAVASKKRLFKAEEQKKATYDYILADLIGKSVSRVYNSANTMPEIQEVYPKLFNSKEIEEKKAEYKAELSAARFRQFAQLHNKKYTEGGANKE